MPLAAPSPKKHCTKDKQDYSKGSRPRSAAHIDTAQLLLALLLILILHALDPSVLSKTNNANLEEIKSEQTERKPNRNGERVAQQMKQTRQADSTAAAQRGEHREKSSQNTSIGGRTAV